MAEKMIVLCRWVEFSIVLTPLAVVGWPPERQTAQVAEWRLLVGPLCTDHTL